MPKKREFQPLDTRFWSKVQFDDYDKCWQWMGKQVVKGGYGIFQMPGRKSYATTAPRVAFYLTYGNWPLNDCLHSCDNPKCCNPLHLRDGDDVENTLDKIFRNRTRYINGENHPGTKFNNSDIVKIREMYASGKYTYKDIAANYEVHLSTIAYIVNKKNWRHV